ncbi:peroxiredoxin [Dysgonomonas sp. 511]|uniref:peroxiredoxin family protein n=1 Tax=Dysgonomonas sp. 511 TaxID=2302930 RepID=UPI0013D7D354|nr:TlpA disulfide reductase family protein [Dysgonomonas sp. 511]NDV77626.1 AhpC/TSA family protein [Dysgonomonas sp. 511]
MKYNILIIMSLLFLAKMEAQNKTDAFSLKVEIPTQKNKKLYLGQYWKETTYAIDSILLDKNGAGHFASPTKLTEGQYFLYIKPDFRADILIGEEQNDIELQIKAGNLLQNKVKGSKDTKILWEYLHGMDALNQKMDTLYKEQKNRKNLTDMEVDNLEKQIEQAKGQSAQFTENLIKVNAGTWASAFIKGMQPVKLLHPQVTTLEEYKENIQYGKNHFFDNIDLTDPRFWNTNYFNSYIDTYMQHWVEANFDSIPVAASRLVSKTQGNDFCYKEMLSKLMNKSLASKVMGDENVWMKLYEDYIIGKKVEWITTEQMTELGRMYEYGKHNRIGMVAHNLGLQTIGGDSIHTNDIDAQYIILYFYDPGCGHCRTEMPIINEEIYKKYKDKGLKMVAININMEQKKWADFIEEKGLEDWINCADAGHKSEYWMYYDTSGVPSTYILDKNKKIIAKKVDKDNMLKILDHYTKE